MPLKRDNTKMTPCVQYPLVAFCARKSHACMHAMDKWIDIYIYDFVALSPLRLIYTTMCVSHKVE